MTTPDSNQPHQRHHDADPMVDALLVEFVPGDPSKQKRPPDLSAKIVTQLSSPTDSPVPDQIDDADAMIDALLAEFLPTDPSQRKSPPDLSAEILQRLADPAANADAEQAEDADPLVDALLAEFISSDPIKRKCPPDLSAQILAQLEGPPKVAAEQTVPATSTADQPQITVQQVSAWTPARVISVLVAIAACLAGVIWLAGRSDVPNGIAGSGPDPLSVAEADTPDDQSQGQSNAGVPQPGGSNLAQNDSPGDPSVKPVRGIPLNRPSIALDSRGGQVDGSKPEQGISSTKKAVAVTLVAAETAETARDYWKTLGITPTPDAAASEIAVRLKQRLGVDLSAEALADPQRLRNVLAKSSNSKEIAKRWLASTTGKSVSAIARSENANLVNELARGVAGQSQFDVTLTSLIDGSSDHSARWYETLGRGGTEGIAKRLASVSMNADLRCVKCHDSRIGRSGTQDDYWSFVALVNNVFRRTDNRWVVSSDPKPTPKFFELPDGRQRMAEAKVSDHLLKSSTEIDDFQTWTTTLIGSRALAGSMVDSLWKLVHGRKLKPSPVDAFAPPVDGNLDRLHTQLAQDLEDSQFDVARTLALIISSPMAQRSVPEALRSDAMITTTDKQRSDALELVGAFAASVETPRSSRKVRIDVAMRRIGGLLSTDDKDTLLAQPIDVNRRPIQNRSPSEDRKPVVSFTQQLAVDFPGTDSSLPVSWLRSIDDFDQQVQHLVYLSGGYQVSRGIKDAANRLKDAGSEESALSRIWWILRD